MAFSLKRAVLSLLSVAPLLTSASPTPEEKKTVARGTSYENAVYFTNWYVLGACRNKGGSG